MNKFQSFNVAARINIVRASCSDFFLAGMVIAAAVNPVWALAQQYGGPKTGIVDGTGTQTFTPANPGKVSVQRSGTSQTSPQNLSPVSVPADSWTYVWTADNLAQIVTLTPASGSSPICSISYNGGTSISLALGAGYSWSPAPNSNIYVYCNVNAVINVDSEH